MLNVIYGFQTPDMDDCEIGDYEPKHWCYYLDAETALDAIKGEADIHTETTYTLTRFIISEAFPLFELAIHLLHDDKSQWVRRTEPMCEVKFAGTDENDNVLVSIKQLHTV